MFNFLQLALVLIIFNCSRLMTATDLPKQLENADTRIVGGYKRQDSNLSKYIVSLRISILRLNFAHFCAGSIISSRTILTAAHCVVSVQKVFVANGIKESVGRSKIKVVAGTSSRIKRTSQMQVLGIRDWLVHPKYNFSQDRKLSAGKNDIALLYLNQSIDLDGTSRDVVPLAETYFIAGTKCMLFGWGVIFEHGPLSDDLLYVNVSIHSEYSETPEKISKVPEYYLATWTASGYTQGGESGDSGGPLICDGVLAGVVSRGSGYDEILFAYLLIPHVTFCTNVSYYHSWIVENMKKKNSAASSTRCTYKFILLLLLFLRF